MQRFVVILICLAATVVEAVYLPESGPPALRFKFAYKGEPVSLPPLMIVEPEVATNKTTNVVTVTNVVNMAAVVTNAPVNPNETNDIPVITNLTNSATNKVAVVVLENKAEASPLPPQMLMQFFRDRGNTNNNTSVVGTVGFTPPPPVAPPSSKATFEKR
jgi:hypothetical protein